VEAVAGPQSATVFFIDFGNVRARAHPHGRARPGGHARLTCYTWVWDAQTETTPFSRLRPIPGQFAALPAQAHEVFLIGVTAPPDTVRPAVPPTQIHRHAHLHTYIHVPYIHAHTDIHNIYAHTYMQTSAAEVGASG
jgi:hypothetical protein